MGSVAGFIVMLVITVIIGLLAWLAREQWLDQQQYELISKEGRLVTIRTDDVNREYRSWKDQFAQIAYLSFTYNNKPYTLRYKQDTGWLTTGDRVALFYHPGTDVFRQPRSYNAFSNNSNQSRLVKFSIISFWNDGRKWLLACIVLTSLFLLLLSGLLATLTGWTIARTAGRFVFMALLLAGVAYLTWNTWQYYRYYNQLKAGAREETVQVLSTYRRSTSKRSNWFYTYEATVQHGKQERVIPIEEEEYRVLKPGAPLQVYYNSQLNDMMSINHSPDYTNLIATLFAWFLALFFIRRQWKKMR
ncbi:hypothetical protein D3H65_00885 [Paraflavitalea soli]|uniref:DUF3592 domain-containing protein n=1 Tax=Paraflavitalea soli TaxID=2315862 RepID=A0A3B7MH21_9BACT|nr:hypothetical protein D3H65_00885 [Paraflavitalea soli]